MRLRVFFIVNAIPTIIILLLVIVPDANASILRKCAVGENLRFVSSQDSPTFHLKIRNLKVFEPVRACTRSAMTITGGSNFLELLHQLSIGAFNRIYSLFHCSSYRQGTLRAIANKVGTSIDLHVKR